MRANGVRPYTYIVRLLRFVQWMVRRACEERDAEGVVPYGCGGKIFRLPNLVVAVGFVFDLFLFNFQVAFGAWHWVLCPRFVYTQNITMHAHVLIQVLYSLFQNLSSYSLSHRACTCPQVSKTPSTYPWKMLFLLHKKMQQLMDYCQIKS